MTVRTQSRFRAWMPIGACLLLACRGAASSVRATSRPTEDLSLQVTEARGNADALTRRYWLELTNRGAEESAVCWSLDVHFMVTRKSGSGYGASLYESSEHDCLTQERAILLKPGESYRTLTTIKLRDLDCDRLEVTAIVTILDSQAAFHIRGTKLVRWRGRLSVAPTR